MMKITIRPCSTERRHHVVYCFAALRKNRWSHEEGESGGREEATSQDRKLKLGQ